MAFGKPIVLCSPFSGTAITQDGEPVPGVVIKRSWVWGWNDNSGLDETVTDANGKFSFPIVTGSSFVASFIPHQPDVKQVITANNGGTELKIWSASKTNYTLNSELDGRKVNVLCYLDKAPSDEGLYWGTCLEDSEN